MLALIPFTLGRNLSDYLQRSCNISQETELRLLTALTALAPLGIASYVHRLSQYFQR